MFNEIMRKYDINVHLKLNTLSSYKLKICEELFNYGLNHINMLVGD